MNWQQGLVLAGAAGLAGMVNSVAGGGTLLTFPALLWALRGQYSPTLIPLVANATSTVALLPGALSSLWGYRDELNQSRRALTALALPSLVGGVIGASLLLKYPGVFKHIVPYLVLLATLLFMAQESISRALRARQQAAEKSRASGVPTAAMLPAATATIGEATSSDTPSVSTQTEGQGDSTPPDAAEAFRSSVPVVLFQLLVAIYGGYFGAGIGIMMLAALGLMGFTNIHRMNGLKNINGFSINVVACLLFAGKGIIDWKIAGVMATGAILGGYFGAGTARRIGQRNVRRIIIFIGFALTLSLLIK